MLANRFSKPREANRTDLSPMQIARLVVGWLLNAAKFGVVVSKPRAFAEDAGNSIAAEVFIRGTNRSCARRPSRKLVRIRRVGESAHFSNYASFGQIDEMVLALNH